MSDQSDQSIAPAAPPSDRTQVHRQPSRGLYDAVTIHNFLDAILIGHIGFNDPGHGFVCVIPTLIARIGDEVLFHTLRISRLAEAARVGEICISAMIEDGVVLAKSAFHHSMNYRSVISFGRAREIVEPQEKDAAMFAFTEKVTPGRWPDIRAPNAKELAMTSIFALSLAEASAKQRQGGPTPEPEDDHYPAPIGVIPLSRVEGAFIPADQI